MPRARRRCAKVDCREWQPCQTHNRSRWNQHSSKHDLPTDWSSRKRFVKGRSGGRCEVIDKFGPTRRRCTNRGASIDHIINRAEWPKGQPGLHDYSNLQNICDYHHTVKTQLESQRGQFRSQRRNK